ncbi:flagellar export chaperone FlgN [Crassaminicella indica]|uniref:Flagellar protein FlgN n=1 Tax=Crassaminicella indica TaxID=2855394 RepID=A0ABX8R9T8_9CLOT|nr:flagellar export chaperone FlgN [Crassaminicella indica]QXM05192.1 flagellar protein FlgN [Crassaminicella indica]
MDKKQIIDELINISKKKEEALKELLDLTKIQEALINNQDLENLAEVINKKQMIMKSIDDIDMHFLGIYNRFKKALGIRAIEDIDTSKYPALKDLKLNISNIMILLKAIEDIDKRNNSQLHAAFDKVKEDMKKLKAKKQSSKIASSYQRKYAAVQGVFIDHK